jgi:HSP20 family protein
VAAGGLQEVTVVALTFDPFREVDRMANQLFGSAMAPARAPRWMPMDLYRMGDQFVVNVDLPGVDPGSIDLDVDGNTLSIRAERTLRADESAQWLAQERPGGAFLRQLNLGDGLDLDGIRAHYENGVLSLTIPVAEQAKPRKIEVQTGGRREEVGPSQSPLQGEVTSG